ncbi:alpha/beta-type small acid-soluble spore protein [Bacillus thuringiensis]|uniref:alpha/beta-type small acid-soluble spore protein n=1 Tax=Bacillus thuringiensis TaxID=1428 RepID=UPI002EB84028|nr:alpha/beta-type small acid-soluble spore protein [Bacillus thuringiensis]
MLFINIQRYESNTNEILISATTSTIEQMKYEIAFGLGVTLGPDTSHLLQMVRIGGEITKRLVRMAEKQLTGQYKLH